MPKIRRLVILRVLLAAGLATLMGHTLAAQDPAPVPVSGRVMLIDRNDAQARDVDQVVIWLTGPRAPAPVPDTVQMATENKQLIPHLLVIPVGATVAFPNHDPFNHNLFSLTPQSAFDLGLYGRGSGKSLQFDRPGVVRVYCNVHAEMRGLIVVQGTALYTQPGADGGFRLEAVPPGDYLLHAWHERAAEITQALRVTAAGAPPVRLTLDARGYRFVQHRDKDGRSYSDRSRRY
jgi:plastocyanin